MLSRDYFARSEIFSEIIRPNGFCECWRRPFSHSRCCDALSEYRKTYVLVRRQFGYVLTHNLPRIPSAHLSTPVPSPPSPSPSPPPPFNPRRAGAQQLMILFFFTNSRCCVCCVSKYFSHRANLHVSHCVSKNLSSQKTICTTN